MAPPKHSTPDTKGVRIFGKGMPHPIKFSVTCARLVSLPQPVSMKV